jgi:acyl-CoA thioester hydrolase
MELFRYIGRVADSVVNLMTHFQTPDELARRSHGVEGGALIELRIAYHAPLRAGSLFTVHSGIRSVQRKVQRFVHLVYEEPAGACAASFDAVAVAMDLRARKAVELPEARRRRMEARLIRLPG